MQAIIMAAGKGSRLGNLTENKPKAFLEIEGIKLIEYNVALLHNYGIKDIVLVTGYQSEQFEKEFAEVEGIRFVYNPFYEMMNVLGSFFMGQEYLKEKDGDVVYMHADTLCAPKIMEGMLNAEGDMILPVEFKTCDEEAMKVKTDDGEIKEISKLIPCDEAEGEFIGIAKISGEILPELKKASKKLMRQKEFMSYFEGAIQELINQGKYRIRAISTNKSFWGEIDFVEDYNNVIENISSELVEIAKKEWKRG